MEFKPITTQEELDRIIGERLKREREKYSDYEDVKKSNQELETQLGQLQKSLEESTESKAEFDKTIAELTSRVNSYEKESLKVKIALANGVPYELASRISGDDEESMVKDAQSLSRMMRYQQPEAPLKETETVVNDIEGAYKQLLQGIQGE